MNRRRFLLTAGALGGILALGALYWPNRWRHIIIHHSGGDFATIDVLQQVHRQRQAGDPIDAIPYHYVIGNGNGLGMGEIASDWRRDFNIWGTHLSANNKAKNFLGIGICLVGNFEQTEVPARQFDALVKLTKSLMLRHGIPAANVDFHGRITGESTKCPGSRFPYQALVQSIS